MEYIIVKTNPMQINYNNCKWFTKKCITWPRRCVKVVPEC